MNDKVLVSTKLTDGALKAIQDFIWAVDLGEIDKEDVHKFYQTLIKEVEVVE